MYQMFVGQEMNVTAIARELNRSGLHSWRRTVERTGRPNHPDTALGIQAAMSMAGRVKSSMHRL
jgi:transposase-like protein